MKKTTIALLLMMAFVARAEDGSRLWLRYEPVSDPMRTLVSQTLLNVNADLSNPSLKLAAEELQQAIKGFTGNELRHTTRPASQTIVLATGGSRIANQLGLRSELSKLHRDGYIIRPIVRNNRSMLVIASPTPVGVLYGVFGLIRAIQTEQFSATYSVVSEPKFDLRMLNHWDNLNGTIERGYAGHSLWMWNEVPSKISPRYAQYARANASVGINAMTPNNVNADPQILSRDYLLKVKTLADIFRPYGVRMFLSINFASPMVLDGLPSADPLLPEVRNWWKSKANEIYQLIPDFGGFLVKANSEGQPGPLDYGRSHVEGANMLAEALNPYNGIVIWRAFVYEPEGVDRAKEAYLEFVPYDGQYHQNVIIQAKSGPVDFQPREPFSPIFGALKKTALLVEVQITQEYTGFSDHLVYLGTQNEEMLRADTWAFGQGSTVAKMTDGTLLPNRLNGIAGVANIGRDSNWTGHHFAQANWYAFGRQAWNHQLSADEIADEWIRMTFTHNPAFRKPVKDLMMSSLETVINYMMPLGLHHLFAWGHHYGPEPWCYVPGARPDWLPRYYHQAATEAIGFDRTRTGSGAVDQYHYPLNEKFNNLATVPEKYLLWYHRVPWNHKMNSGRTLWAEMAHKYQEGVDSVRSYQKTWDKLEPFIDNQRFTHVQSRLRRQIRTAVWWRDAIMLYFQTYSGMPIPYHLERPISDLEELKKIKLDLQHHN